MLVKLPLRFWAATPGPMAVTMLVWFTVIGLLVPVAAEPVPEPLLVQ